LCTCTVFGPPRQRTLMTSLPPLNTMLHLDNHATIYLPIVHIHTYICNLQNNPRRALHPRAPATVGVHVDEMLLNNNSTRAHARDRAPLPLLSPHARLHGAPLPRYRGHLSDASRCGCTPHRQVLLVSNERTRDNGRTQRKQTLASAQIAPSRYITPSSPYTYKPSNRACLTNKPNTDNALVSAHDPTQNTHDRTGVSSHTT
jgi:hypothetical protein